MAHLDAEETRKSYEILMGEEVGRAFYAIYSDLTNLHSAFGDYQALFGFDEKRVQKLNNVAAFFFGRYETVLWQHIILGIARLTDKAKSRDKANLSIQKLFDLLDEGLQPKLSAALERAEEKCKFARSWRDLVIAHRDYPFAVEKRAARTIDPASRLTIKEALAALSFFMNEFVRLFDSTEIRFDLSYGYDALALVNFIEGAESGKSN